MTVPFDHDALRNRNVVPFLNQMAGAAPRPHAIASKGAGAPDEH
jgi:hypothetical protein